MRRGFGDRLQGYLTTPGCRAFPAALGHGNRPLGDSTRRLLGPGMGLAVAGLEALDRHVRVDLGGGGRGMTEDLLDAAQVGTALEQVGRRTVSYTVRPGKIGRASCRERVFN